MILFGSGRSSMVEREFSKLHTRVRFPSPAPPSDDGKDAVAEDFEPVLFHAAIFNKAAV
jgi:hypothetical protein